MANTPVFYNISFDALPTEKTQDEADRDFVRKLAKIMRDYEAGIRKSMKEQGDALIARKRWETGQTLEQVVGHGWQRYLD